MGRAGPCVDAENLEHLMHLLHGVEYKPFEDSASGYAIKVCVLVGAAATSPFLVLLDLFKGWVFEFTLFEAIDRFRDVGPV